MAGTYPKVVATSPGFDGVTSSVTVTGGTTTRDFALRRDWAASSGGATVGAFDGPDFGPGCGPADMIDQSPTEGWSTTADFVDGQVSADTPKSMVIALPQAITVSEIAIDPAATCGDGGSASLAGYSVETSPDGTTWTLASEGRFTIDNRGQLNSIALDPAATSGVAFVRLTMKDPQVFDIGGICPGGFSGCDFMDATEIAVYGS